MEAKNSINFEIFADIFSTCQKLVVMSSLKQKSLKRTAGAAGLMDKFVIRSGKASECSSEASAESTDKDCVPQPPKKQKRSGHRTSGFDPKWLEDFPWVEQYENGMKCKLCTAHQRRPKQTPLGKAVWVDKPCISLYRHSLTSHEKSEVHGEAVAFEAELRLKKRQIESQMEKMTTVNKMARAAAFRTLYWLAKEELPHTTKYIPLLELCKEQGVSVLNNLNNGENDKGESERFVQEAILTMGRVIKEPILADIQQSPYYSIMVDETTDVEVVKELIIYIRYMKDGKALTEFLRIVPLLDGTANSIVSAVTTLLSEIELPLHKLCAIGSDGASVMVGRKNGVVAKLREMVPHLIGNHCVAHRLALAVGQAAKGIPHLEQFKDILDQLFRFYRNSAVRMAGLQEIQRLMNNQALKLQQAKDVRWLSNDNATRSLYKCFPAVVTSLEREAAERADAQAMGLSVFVQNTNFIRSLLMMRDVLPHLSQLSTSLQKKDMTYTTVGPLVAGTVAIMEKLRQKPGDHFNQATDYINGLHSEGFKIRNGKSDEDYLESIYHRFLDNIIQNLKDRFPDLPIISQFAVFDSSAFPDDHDDLYDYGNEEIQELARHFNLDEEKAKEQWRSIKQTVASQEGLKSANDVMEFVSKELPESHSVISNLATIGLLIPASTADCERGFSTLKRVKTTHRSSLSNKVLNALLTVCMQGQSLDRVDFNNIVEEWWREKPRRTDIHL